MSSPRLARSARGGRYYEVGGERYWSVTTILQGVPKPALPRWAAKAAAEWTIGNLPAVNAMAESDPAAAVEAIKQAPWRESRKKMDLGSEVHAIAEAWAMGTELPEWSDEAAPFLSSFAGFLEEWSPTFEMTEATVANHQYRYAGTLDSIMVLDGRRVIADYKTGKDIYPESALQLAAYRYAEIVLMEDGSEVALPEVDGGVVIHLTDRGVRVIPVRCDRPVFESFLFVREVWRFQEQTSKYLIGDPVAPSQEAVVAAP